MGEQPKFETAPELKIETISGRELFEELFDRKLHKPKSRFASLDNGGVFHYSPFDSKMTKAGTVFSVVRENSEIIGLAKLHQNPRDGNVLWLMSVSVDKNRKGEGISEKLLEEVFVYAKSKGMKIGPSRYTKEGEERLKHQIERLASKHNVEISEED